MLMTVLLKPLRFINPYKRLCFAIFVLKQYVENEDSKADAQVVFFRTEMEEEKGREGLKRATAVKSEMNHVLYFHPCKSAWSGLNSACGARDFNSGIKKMRR